MKWLISKLIRKIDKNGERAVKIIGHKFLDHVSNSAFKIFQAEKFRELVKFSKQSQEEQDRIFNELEVAAICILIFGSNAAGDIAKPENIHFWLKIGERMPDFFEEKLLSYGVDETNANLFRKLILMRLEEYQESQQEITSIWAQDDPRYHQMPESIRDASSRVHAVTIGTTNHIRRGKMISKDPLLKYLIEWLLPLNEWVGKQIIKI